MCAALKKVPTRFKEQSTTVPVDEGIGKRFSADVIKREKQLILFMKEYVSSYSDACFIPSEKADSLQDGIVRLMARFRAPSGPPVILRVDPGKGFESLAANKSLSKLHITLELGAPKNKNHNPVAEKGISEFHAEVVRITPTGGPIDEVTLSLTISNLNSRIRQAGLSAMEIWHQRDMQTGAQLPIKDLDVIRNKVVYREKGHLPSAKYKARGLISDGSTITTPGEIVYLYEDRDKTKSRDRYIVVRTERNKSYVKKFIGSQLRSKIYEVDNADIIKVTPHQFPQIQLDSLDEQTCGIDIRPYTPDVIEESYSTGDESIDSEYENSPEHAGGGNPDVETDEEEVQLNNGIEEVQQDKGLRRSSRSRKEPTKFKAYFTGKRLNQAVPEED